MVELVAAPSDSRLEEALAFIGELRLPSGLRLADSFQTDPWLLDSVVRPVLAKQPDGMPTHKFCWIELPKGAGKSTIAAGLMLTEAAQSPGTEVFITASDAEQARIILEALAGLIRSYPRLSAMVTQTQNIFRLTNGSFLRVMASDAASYHGIAVTAQRTKYVCEELTQWADPSMYHAQMASLPKHSDSQLLVITNAGIIDSWAATAKEKLVATGAWMHVSEAGWLPSWVSEESIAAVRDVLPESEWRRYYRNEWISPIAGQAIDPEDWDACAAKIPPLDPRTPLVVGVDAGIKNDTFAITVVSRSAEAQERELVTSHEIGFSMFVPRRTEAPKVVVRHTKIWEPEGGQPLDFDIPFQWLASFVRSHRVVCIVYDEWQLHDWAVRMQREHHVWAEAFSQGEKRGTADIDLLSLIRSRRLVHDGDGQLREHALNASLKMPVSEDTKARFIKSKAGHKIDALIALSMAASQVLYLNLD